MNCVCASESIDGSHPTTIALDRDWWQLSENKELIKKQHPPPLRSRTKNTIWKFHIQNVIILIKIIVVVVKIK